METLFKAIGSGALVVQFAVVVLCYFGVLRKLERGSWRGLWFIGTAYFLMWLRRTSVVMVEPGYSSVYVMVLGVLSLVISCLHLLGVILLAHEIQERVIARRAIISKHGLGTSESREGEG